MSDIAEAAESSDPFSKQVAVTIAILTVFLAFIGNKGDNAKTEALLKTSEAANQWGYYQSKSIKQNTTESEVSILSNLPGGGNQAKRDAAIAKVESSVKRYELEKQEIKKKAESLELIARQSELVNDRCDQASLVLQIGVIICSISILSKWRLFWHIGMFLGTVGGVIGITAFLL
ncbi:MAG: DUF4337 domain-containing protein [Pedosphaera sp.]|nr:DUF4337 domain-containing protein [Pedosphaera sp.]